MKVLKNVSRLRPMLPKINPMINSSEKINPVRKPDIIGFRKILESRDPLRSVSAFFRFEDIAVSKERYQLVFDDVLKLLNLLADKHAPKIADVQQILTIMKQLGIPKTVDIYNAYLKVLIKNNDFKATRLVMQEMKENDVDLTTESYVSIIQAFEDEKHFHGILEFVDNMKQEGLSVNEEVYRHLLVVALKDSHNFKNFEYVLNIIHDLGYQNHPRIVDVVLKYKILRDGIDEAETMVTRLLELEDYHDEAKSRILCTLLTGFLARKQYEMVLHYLKFMEEKGFKIYKKAYHIHIACLFQMGKCEDALKVYEEMEAKGLEADQFTYLSLITGLCLNNELTKAAELFNRFHTLDLPRLGPIYRVLLEAHCERNLVDDAEALFKFMIKHNIHISEGIYNIMFRLALNTLNMKLMEKYWLKMTVNGEGMKNEYSFAATDGNDKEKMKLIRPSAESFCIYISLFLKCHRLEEANEKFQEMVDADREPDAAVLGNLLESNILARNFSGAAKAIQWMRKYSANSSGLSDKIREYIHGRASEFEMIIHDLYQPALIENDESMIESMETSSKRELIISIYNELKIVGMKISEKTYKLLMTIYDEQKDFVNVVKAWTHLIESKIVPQTETINVLLRSAKKYGRQRTIIALISFFEKETSMKLNVESFKLLFSMAASFGKSSEIRCLILELANHDLQLTPAMFNEMENAFRSNPQYWRSYNHIRDFVEEYFPEALVIAEEEEYEEKDEKMPEWFKNVEDQNQN